MALINYMDQGMPVTGFLPLMLHKRYYTTFGSESDFPFAFFLTGVHFGICDITKFAFHDFSGQLVLGLGFMTVAYVVSSLFNAFINYGASCLNIRDSKTFNMLTRPVCWILTAIVLSPVFGKITTSLLALAPVIVIAMCTSMLAEGFLKKAAWIT